MNTVTIHRATARKGKIAIFAADRLLAYRTESPAAVVAAMAVAGIGPAYALELAATMGATAREI